jgi:hypothetical protein
VACLKQQCRENQRNEIKNFDSSRYHSGSYGGMGNEVTRKPERCCVDA